MDVIIFGYVKILGIPLLNVAYRWYTAKLFNIMKYNWMILDTQKSKVLSFCDASSHFPISLEPNLIMFL